MSAVGAEPRTLEQLEELGVLTTVDVHVARTVARLVEECDPSVLLGVALASRAPRHGHVCVELDEVAARITVERTDEEDEVELIWPQVDGWTTALAASPAVRGRDDEHATPLVLDGRRLYLDRYWRYQGRLRDRLIDLAARSGREVDATVVRREIERLFPDEPGSELDRQQVAAALAAGRDLTVISGGPGTGKTTTIVRLLALLLATEEGQGRDGELRIALAAPTGKAAARMQEAIRDATPELNADEAVKARLAGLDASTIHRLLGWNSGNSTRFRHDADRPLAYDVVVVDEASMVSLALMAKLIDAIPDGGRLVLVGDREQLASVEAGAVLGDICGSRRVPDGRTLRLSAACADDVAERTGLDVRAEAEIVSEPGIWDGIVQLERFYRFGPETGIGAIARGIQRIEDSTEEVMAYLRGEATEDGRTGAYDDIRLVAPVEERVPDDVKEAIVRGYGPAVEAAVTGADPREVLRLFDRQRVLAALRRGPQGVATLNELIEGWLAAEIERFVPEGGWYVGRPVIVTSNDYGVGLFNGDVGVVVEEPDTRARTVAFPDTDGQVRHVGAARLPAHETVFAMTVHKAQGSQFDRVHLVLPTVDVPLLTRELVYTGVTRAESDVTIVADEAILRAALTRPVQRASGLADELWP